MSTDNKITVIEQETNTSSNKMIFSPEVMSQALAVAEMMASSIVTIPKHLQKLPGDCFAIIMQAAQWNMSPYAVAQKTHLVNGTLGYEAQLVNAVISSSKAIKGRFHYEYSGDWKKHNIAGSDCCIRTGAVLKGESEITWGEWLFAGNITIKNSPLWKTAPKQQAAYLAVKYWSRIYCPEVIMGVYTPDELQATDIPDEKEINPIQTEAPKSRIDAVKEKAKQKAVKKESVKLVDEQTGEIDGTNEVHLSDILKNIDSATDIETLDFAVDLARLLNDGDKRAARAAYIEKLNSF